jgi:hypothetical protein
MGRKRTANSETTAIHLAVYCALVFPAVFGVLIVVPRMLTAIHDEGSTPVGALANDPIVGPVTDGFTRAAAPKEITSPFIAIARASGSGGGGGGGGSGSCGSGSGSGQQQQQQQSSEPTTTSGASQASQSWPQQDTQQQAPLPEVTITNAYDDLTTHCLDKNRTAKQQRCAKEKNIGSCRRAFDMYTANGALIPFEDNGTGSCVTAKNAGACASCGPLGFSTSGTGTACEPAASFGKEGSFSCRTFADTIEKTEEPNSALQ